MKTRQMGIRGMVGDACADRRRSGPGTHTQGGGSWGRFAGANQPVVVGEVAGGP